ncbi:hypothetical protein PG985_016190 [Apiospora marii]|uniref:uncharacterized protein n=1 Tax=Apiospora marii TaxID=335849 RepID=UPI0031319932
MVRALLLLLPLRLPSLSLSPSLVPEPFVLSPAQIPLSADTLRIDKLPCLRHLAPPELRRGKNDLYRSQELALSVLGQVVEPAEDFDAGLCNIMQRHLSAADWEQFRSRGRIPVDENIPDADINDVRSAELVVREQPSNEDVDMDDNDSWAWEKVIKHEERELM